MIWKKIFFSLSMNMLLFGSESMFIAAAVLLEAHQLRSLFASAKK